MNIKATTKKFGEVAVIGFLGDSDRFQVICVNQEGKLLNVPRMDVFITEIEGEKLNVKPFTPVPPTVKPAVQPPSQAEIEKQKALDNRPIEARVQGEPVKIEGDGDDVPMPPATLEPRPMALTEEEKERIEAAREFAEQEKKNSKKNK